MMAPEIFLRGAVIILFLYGMVCLGLFIAQRRMIYFPDQSRIDLHARAFPVVAVDVKTADGVDLRGWYLPPQDGQGVVVLFHGNAGNAAGRLFKAAPALQAGMGYLLAEYRGYGGNAGKPSEQGLYADGRAFVRWLIDGQGFDEGNIILAGESLGTGVATKLATEFPRVRAVILETPYTSFVDLARHYYPVFPARLIVRDRYDNLARMADLTGPVLILHGRRDEIVPYAHAERLAQAAQGRAKLVTFDEGHHNDLYNHGAAMVISDFLNGLVKSRKNENGESNK